MAGMPKLTASNAAHTVPDDVMSQLMFTPWFIPVITRSGLSSITYSAPTITASAGLPETLYASLPSSSSTVLISKCLNKVIRRPTLLLFSSGATTVTLAKSSTACFAANIPGANTPSSFDIRMFINLKTQKRLYDLISLFFS